MNCQQTGTHTVKPGDSLYQIAQMHKMTLPQLMAMNPGIEPYNLLVGQLVTICRDGETDHGHTENGGECPAAQAVLTLNNRMRLAWLQHVYWARMLLTSIVEGAADQQAVENRLMRNPADIAAVFADYYPREAVKELERLLNGHVMIGAELIKTWSRREMERADELNRQWYMNASQIAAQLASMNPNYPQEETASMLYRHLELMKEEIAERIAGNYEADIAAFDRVEQEALNMADYFTNGILQQFPEDFR